jgi:hypothetical protein
LRRGQGPLPNSEISFILGVNHGPKIIAHFDVHHYGGHIEST